MRVAERQELDEVWRDPWEFMCRLTVKDQHNVRHRLNNLWPEQRQWVQALLGVGPFAAPGGGPKKYVLGLKPRQLGFTTWATAYLFWRAFTSPDPRLELQLVHDEQGRDRVRDMVGEFMGGMPPFWASKFKRGHDNDASSIFVHNDGGFARRVAGAKGKFRSWTSNDMHATEVAHWASATSAGRRDSAGDDAETMWASALAAQHDPTGRVIVESTGNGPFGLFYDLAQQAQDDPKWAFVFEPWSAVSRYREAIDDATRRQLEQELTPAEEAMLKDGLDFEQLAWRRTKMRTERYSELRFCREYPLSPLDPFLLAQSGWFDQEVLARLLKYVGEHGASEETFIQYRAPEPGMPYFMGVDPSGGTGRDSSVVQILDIRLRHCARWATNRASVPEQANMVSRLGHLYNEPLTVIEANNMGERLIPLVAERGGVRLWKSDDDDDFWTTGGGRSAAASRKREALVHARQMIEEGWCGIRCARTIREAQTVVEKDNGKIEAAGRGHDDHIMAYVFALWAAKRANRRDKTAEETERDRLRRLWTEGIGGNR